MFESIPLTKRESGGGFKSSEVSYDDRSSNVRQVRTPSITVLNVTHPFKTTLPPTAIPELNFFPNGFVKNT